MKENYGAFNRSNYYFSLNRQNSKFQQKGLVFNLKKGKLKICDIMQTSKEMTKITMC